MEILCGASIAIGACGSDDAEEGGGFVGAAGGAAFCCSDSEGAAHHDLERGIRVQPNPGVRESKGKRWLVLNDSRFAQTVERVGGGSSGFYLDEFALGPVIVPAKNLLVLGMGAGGSIQASESGGARD